MSRSKEVQKAQTIKVCLIGRQSNNAVHSTFQVAGGPKLVDIGHIDSDATWQRLYPFPGAIGHPDLKRCNGMAE